MHEFHASLALLGILVISLGFLSIPIERFPLLSRPIIALGVGILVGPLGLRWLDPQRWGQSHGKILEVTASLTMAIALMGVALRLPKKYFLENRRSMAAILLLVMPLMWLASSAVIGLTIGLPLWVALLAGAVVTPTDPVLSTTVVQGKMAEENLPDRIRHAISAEAGANDGLAFPLVFLPLLVLTRTGMEVPREWFLRVLLWEVGGAIVLGGLLGYLTGRVMEGCEKRKWMEKPSFLAVTLSLTLLALGGSELARINGILAVFAAGIGFDQATTASERSDEEKVQESINQFFTVPIFALFGLFLPWGEWTQLGWKGVSAVVGVLLLRRLPFFLLLRRWIPSLKGSRDAGFAGWFGPIGVAAIYYASVAETQTGQREVWVIGSLVVFASLIVHGLTETPLTRAYAGGRRRGSSESGRLSGKLR